PTAALRYLLSCPTRRSSDLRERRDNQTRASAVVVISDGDSHVCLLPPSKTEGHILLSGNICKSPVAIVVQEEVRTLVVCYKEIEDRKSTRLNSSHEWISYAV